MFEGKPSKSGSGDPFRMGRTRKFLLTKFEDREMVGRGGSY